MKPTVSFLIVVMAVLVLSCQNEKKPPRTQSPLPIQTPTPDMPAPTAVVQHYICPNNCAGSGSAQAGLCSVCGAQYLHNDAFHNQPGNSANNSQLPPPPIIINPQQTPQTQTTPQPNQQEPAQNAAGTWHYICSAGCDGGSGTRGYCAKCGAGLDHNQAYHQ